MCFHPILSYPFAFKPITIFGVQLSPSERLLGNLGWEIHCMENFQIALCKLLVFFLLSIGIFYLQCPLYVTVFLVILEGKS